MSEQAMMTREEAKIIAEELKLLLSEKMSEDEDYDIKDIRAKTGLSARKASEFTFHGQYYVGGKRKIRREIFDYRRKMGLNVAVDKD